MLVTPKRDARFSNSADHSAFPHRHPTATIGAEACKTRFVKAVHELSRWELDHSFSTIASTSFAIILSMSFSTSPATRFSSTTSPASAMLQPSFASSTALSARSHELRAEMEAARHRATQEQARLRGAKAHKDRSYEEAETLPDEASGYGAGCPFGYCPDVGI